jgi:Polyketide synthase dehydratase
LLEIRLKIQIDPAVDTFLLDHVVDGAPLLPTVMQLDVVAHALQAAGATQGKAERPAGMLLRDIRVGPPARFSPPAARELDLLYTPDPAAPPGQRALRCELRSAGHDVPHLTAAAQPAAGPAPRVLAPRDWMYCLPCGPDLVYPPFFHGPAFRVVMAFGRVGRGLAALLAPGLPPLSWGSGPTVLQPQLLELLLQCCGIQELASSGRMMIPDRIEAVHWHPGSLAADDRSSAIAVVLARAGQHGRSRVFDGQVVTSAGAALVTVTGYRATDLGHGANLGHAALLTRSLASHPEPAPYSPAGTAIPEGAQR